MSQRQQLEEAIAAIEAQRATLGDAVVEAALEPLRRQLAQLDQAESPASSPPTLQGERKLVTVMFAALSGFTRLAETMEPEVVRDLMNACFEHLVPVIEKYEGTVHKFIGDEMMVLFGVPVVHENDSERALRAALEMQESLAEFNADRATDLGLHLGIDTGMVITGDIGTRERQEFSVMGEPVNLASWLGEISEPGDTLVGPDTYRLTGHLFVFKSTEPVRVKGKAEPIQARRLLARKSITSTLRGTSGLASTLVGRRSELRALQQALERLKTGQGGIITLVGEAGLGKSRLVMELKHQARAELPDLNWIEGRCQSYGTSIAYLLWLNLLRDWLQVTPEQAPADVRQALQTHVGSLCPDCPDDVYPYLAWLLGLPSDAEGEPIGRDLEGENLKRNTFQAVASLLRGAAQTHSLIIVCENLHWVDPTSVELLEQLLTLTEQIPLLFVCTFRPETGRGCWRVRETAARLYTDLHTDLWLDPLSAAESHDLVVNLLRAQEELPSKLSQRLLSHAEGNPLYVEELVRSLIENGAIVREQKDKGWRVAQDVDQIAIPDTLHGVLMARIDQLPEGAKRILQLASVIGRAFNHRVLAAIAPQDPQLDQHLLTLQREGMIRQQARAPEREYVFKHHLTQETAYSSLLQEERQRFHRRVATALEKLLAERIDEQIGLLAYHWERTDEATKAIEYLLQAGDQARLTYAHEEAIGYYQRALRLLEEQAKAEQAARTQMKLGLTYHTALDFQRARQAFEAGFALWQEAAEAEPAVPPEPAPHPLRVAWLDPTTLDPTRAWDVYSSAVIDQLFNGLVELGPDLDVVPALAHTWEVLEGGRKYIFHLRQDMTWSDGTPVTAGDFEYAWKRVLDPDTESPAASLLYDIRGAKPFHQGEINDADQVGVQAVDETTLAIELDEPASYFPHLLTYQPTYPVPRHAVQTHGKAWTDLDKIVTNGPFTLKSWQRGQSMTLVRNPAYRGHFRGNVQQVELSLLADRAAQLSLYEDDQLDSLNLWLLAPPDRDRARHRHAGDYISVPSLVTIFVGFESNQPPFDDPQVRRAFVLATDRETLADVFMSGYEFPASGGFVPPRMPGHSPDIGLDYDVEQARKLLAQAGYPDSQNFPTVNALTSAGYAPLSQYLRAHWQENLGIEINWKTIQWKSFIDGLQTAPINMFLVGWSAPYPDPDNFLRMSPAWQHTHWQNQTFSQLVEQARRVTDQSKRMELYKEAEKILIEQAPIIPLTYRRLHLLVKPWVRKYPTSAIKHWFWKDVVVEPH